MATNLTVQTNVSKIKDVNHYTSTLEKQTREWYIPAARIYVNKLHSANDTELRLKALNAANGLYDEQTKLKFLSLINATKFVEEVKDLDVLDTVDIITPITRRIIGEFIRQPDNDYDCKVDDPSATTNLNSIVYTKITKILMERLQEKIQSVMSNAEQNNTPVEEAMKSINIEDEIKKIKKDFFLKQGENAKAMVDAVVSKTNLIHNLTQQFFNFYATEHVYTVIDVKENNIDLIHIQPHQYYRLPASVESDTENDLAGMYEVNIPYYEFKERFKDKLNIDEYNALISIIESPNSDAISAAKQLFSLVGHFDYDNTNDSSYIDGITNSFNAVDSIKGKRLFIRTKRKYGILKHVIETGEVEEILVNETYKLNTLLGDISIEWEWKDAIMEMWIFNNIENNIMTKPEYLTYQREYLSNHNKVLLPVVGKSGLLINYVQNPISLRLIPLNILYKFLTIKVYAEISKFQGFINAIPESILNTSPNFSLKERLDYLFQSNLLMFDDSQVNVNSLQAMRTIGSYQADYISQLLQIKSGIKSEAWEIADMNQERYGEIDTRGGKANTEQAIIRVSTGSLLMFTSFDSYLEKLYQAIADYTRLVSVSGITIEKTKDGIKERINIPYDVLLNTELGIHFKKSQIEKEKLDYLKQTVVQAAMQNNQFELSIEAIDTDSMNKIKLIANDISEIASQRDKYYKELEVQIEQEKTVRLEKAEDKKYASELQIANVKGEYELLKKDKDLLIKMVEFSSFNPESNKYENDINILEQEIKTAELQIKNAQRNLLVEKTNSVRNKNNTVKK